MYRRQKLSTSAIYVYVHKNTYVAQVNISVIELIGQLKCVVLFFTIKLSKSQQCLEQKELFRVEKRSWKERDNAFLTLLGSRHVGRLNGGIVIKIDDAKRAVIRIIDGSDGCY